MNNIFYITYTGAEVSRTDLEIMFETVGDVESLKLLPRTEEISDYGHGVVVMGTGEQATDCIARFHGNSSLGASLGLSRNPPNAFSA